MIVVVSKPFGTRISLANKKKTKKKKRERERERERERKELIKLFVQS
jgi:hypothetical protein